MKTNIYILSLIAIFGWGCSKKTEPSPEKPTYDVTFSVSGMETSTDKISPARKQQSLSATANPHELVSYVNLYVYNAEGSLVAEIEEQCCGSADGILIENLEIGTYTAVAVGHTDGVTKTWFSTLEAARLQFQYSDKFYGQAFVDKVAFEVKNIDNNRVDLVLQRKVGLLDIDITDNAPSDVHFVRATLHSMASEYSINDFMALHSNINVGFSRDYIYGPSDFGGYFFVPYDDQAYTSSVLLEVIGTNGTVIKSKWIENVTVGTNIKTTLRGKLFEPNAQGFTIEIDPEWGGENTIDF